MEPIFAIALAVLLPRWLRDEAGPDMRAVFAVGQARARTKGAGALLRFWAREFAGLAATAFRARHPDRWARRTAAVGLRHDVAKKRGFGDGMGMRADTVGSDVRYAFRAIVRRPGVATLTVLTLSLGIGASTAMFGVVQSVLLKPLPYPSPEQLVSVYPARPSLRGHPTFGYLAERGTWSWGEFSLVAGHQSVFEQFAAYEELGLTRTGEGPAYRVSAVRASWELFPMLGARPAAGRLFTENDLDVSRVVMLSHGAWRDQFGGDPAVIDRTVLLDDEAYEIVGVLAAGFRLTDLRPSYWLPPTGRFADAGLGNHRVTRAVARLADGVSIERARDEITALFASLLPPDHGEHVASIFPRQADETRIDRPVILVMLAAAVLLLLVASGNAAALLLGAGIDRESEFALRNALGASRGRIIRQLLIESSVLGVLSVGGGILAASSLTWAMLRIAPAAVPGLSQASLDLVVLGFAALTAVAFGIGFGMIPALSVSKVDIAGAMGSGRSTGGPRARLQSAIVIGELGLACTLAVSGLLLVRTVGALDGTDPGFAFDELSAVAVATPFQRFRTADGRTDNAALDVYLTRLLREIEGVPGVQSVSATSVPPFSDWLGGNDVIPQGWDSAIPPPIAERRTVTPGFFQTAGIEIVQGRAFTADAALADARPTVVLSQGLANLGWPGESPIGRTLSYWGLDATVIGVARNIRDMNIEEVTELAFYAPGTAGQFLIRAHADPTAVLPPIRDRIQSFDPNLPILLSSSLPDLIKESIAEERYRAGLISLFAGLSSLLALLGIYSVTARSVSRRTREIGVRVALGADRGNVRRLVSLQALKLGALGAIVGVAGALVSSSIIESFLWGVRVSDPVTLGIVMVAMPLLAVLAASVPAGRATRIDPLRALRAE